MNIAVFHPSYGPNYPESQMKGRVTFKPSQPELSSPSIEISDVRMTDEGRYVCEYATYPDGNEQGITQLVMLAKPVNSATTVAEVAGTKPVVVARCVSRDGRPAAKIRWVTTAKGNWTETSKTGADNTVTVTSEYRLAPTPTDNAKDLTCLVNHRTQLKDESLPLKLAIRYPPMVEIEGYDNNWYLGRTNVGLLCKANANPVPHTVQWTTMTGQLPDTVLPNEKELKVLKVDNSVNTTFVCEVKNSIGTTREQITIHVRATRLPQKGATTGSIIGAIIGVVLVMAAIGTGIAMYRKRKNKLNSDGPPKYKPPPPKKTSSSKKRSQPLIPGNVPVTQDAPLQSQYYSTQAPEPVTDLDGYQEDAVDDELEAHDGEVYFSSAPSGWNDPKNNDVPPPYMLTNSDLQDNNGSLPVSRGDSFISSAMIV
uniref:Si:ch73-22o12.1 n=2 Tax=Poecilia latipinna TaxID=48699 RepID=A0A3B3VPK1_9TELE